jgi:hypothetical protein
MQLTAVKQFDPLDGDFMSENATPTGAEAPTTFSVGDEGLLSAISSAIGEPVDEPEIEEEFEEGTDPDAAPASQSEDDIPSSDESRFEVKIDGELKYVTEGELKAAYQKAQASAKRFEEAASLRKQYEAQAQEVQQRQNQLQQALDHYTQQLTALQHQEQPNWESLLQNNPAEYLKQKHAWEQRQTELQQAQAAQAYLYQQQQSEAHAQQQAFLEQQSKLVLDMIPEWKNAETAKSERQELRKFLSEAGFEDEVIQNVRDARAVNVMRKAMLYDKLMKNQQPSLKKASKAPPRVERPGLAGSGKDSVQQAKSRAMKTGSVRDAAAAMAALFENTSS